MLQNKYAKNFVILLAECLVILFYGVFFHWSHLKNPTTRTDVRVIYNEAAVVKNGSNLRLRPGAYNILVAGPFVESKKVKTFLWPFATYSVPTELVKRTDAAIVSEVYGKKVLAENITTIKYESSWMFATIKTSNGDLDIAGRFEVQNWSKIYDSASGVIDGFDVATIPEQTMKLIGLSIVDRGLDDGEPHGD